MESIARADQLTRGQDVLCEEVSIFFTVKRGMCRGGEGGTVHGTVGIGAGGEANEKVGGEEERGGQVGSENGAPRLINKSLQGLPTTADANQKVKPKVGHGAFPEWPAPYR
jgi:hypothetical protein